MRDQSGYKKSGVIILKFRSGLDPKVSSVSSQYIGNHYSALAGKHTTYKVPKGISGSISFSHYFFAIRYSKQKMNRKSEIPPSVKHGRS
jgi:hypothetical protein